MMLSSFKRWRKTLNYAGNKPVSISPVATKGAKSVEATTDKVQKSSMTKLPALSLARFNLLTKMPSKVVQQNQFSRV